MKTLLTALVSLALLAGIASCASTSSPVTEPTPPPPEAEPGSPSYVLGVGDRIRINVFGEPGLSIEATLDESGSLNYPLLGPVHVVGNTTRGVEQHIAQALRQGYLVNPDVRVEVVQFRPIFVTGEVARAGSHPYSLNLSVGKALALAGGMTRLGSARRIYILREHQTTPQRERATLDTPVFPGDTIVVEEGLF